MAYILAVNPLILKDAGMPQAALVTVTALTAAISTLLMAFMTNFPLALAPGMGINAYFTYTVCRARRPRQSALGLVFANGVMFLVLSLTGIREKIVNSIPYSLKIAITCGVGLFIAFIGLKNAGIVVASKATFVTQGDFGSPAVALAFFGIILTAVLVARRVPGAIVLSIAAVTLAGLFVPDGKGGHVTSMPSAIFSLPSSPEPVILSKLDFKFIIENFAKALPIMLTLLIVDMFDNIGTLIGVTKRAGLLRPDGSLPKAGRALVADSFAAILSLLFGTSTVVSYIESASASKPCGRTGLTAVSTACSFPARPLSHALNSNHPRRRHRARARDRRGVYVSDRGGRLNSATSPNHARRRHAPLHSAHLQHRGRPRPRRDRAHLPRSLHRQG